MRRGLLPAALVAIGLVTVIFGDFTGDDRLRAGGVAIVGAAILMAVAGWLLRRPDEAAQFDLRDWASYVTQSREPGSLIVRPDQAELYECAVRAIGADRVVRSGRGWVVNSIAPSTWDCDGRAADTMARGASDQLTMRCRLGRFAACSINVDGSCRAFTRVECQLAGNRSNRALPYAFSGA
jgi:hypothetical protein